MKRDKLKMLALPLVLLLVLTMVFFGCGSGSENSAPEVDGAHDIECIINTKVDLLDEVAALDEEDGDITPNMDISVTPEVPVENGYAVFPSAGNYRVTYSITDSAGEQVNESVLITAVEREFYSDFISVGGFRGEASGQAVLKKNGMYNGVYTITAEKAEIAEDVQITRTFSLISGFQHTFTYHYYSNKSGRATISANGEFVSDVYISKGENELSFTYTPTAETESVSKEIALLLGGISEEFTFYLFDASYSLPPVSEGNIIPNFTFNCKVYSRFDGTTGNAFSSDGGQSATLEVTSSSADIWRGGMFINTGVSFVANCTYTVSYDVKAKNEDVFEIILQRDQWNEYKYHIENVSNATELKHITNTFTVTAETAGAFWIYVQSGTAVNNIVFSNLVIEAKSNGVRLETLELKDFTSSEADGYSGELKTEAGNFAYTVPKFAATDWQQQVISPEFFIGGSGENYVITFKAKATKPIVTVFAAPKYGGWDPVWVWSRITITEEEQVFTFYGSSACSDSNQNFVWQFGNISNQAYSNVTIEISDIKISYKNSTLD